jgi:glycosyltransferase involved in cell wall biosynthesis
MKVAILHYSAPPVIGGVEQTMFYHARYLEKAGHDVRLVAGAGESMGDQVRLHLIPQAGSRDPQVAAVQAELNEGRCTPAFDSLRDGLRTALGDALSGCDTLIVHNVCTLHKNLALTAALHDYLATAAGLRVLAWHHDLAWTNEQYLPQLRDGYPWDLLRRPWPGVHHVTVSQARRAELAALYGISPPDITVVPPGVDPSLFYRWDAVTATLVERFGLLDAGPVFLLPARLTRRKNVEAALRILAAYRERTGSNARLVVTGPPGPHNAANLAYLDALLDLRDALGLDDAAHFLYETGCAISDAVMADLYLLCDALLFPSAQEGFGIPILEAGLARLPIFCSDIPPLRETGDGTAHFFDPEDDPGAIAAMVAEVLEADRSYGLRRRVLGSGTWSRIVEEQLLPLLR